MELDVDGNCDGTNDNDSMESGTVVTWEAERAAAIESLVVLWAPDVEAGAETDVLVVSEGV